MTPEQWAYLETYVRDLADRMGLRDWAMVMKRDPPDEESSGAQIEVIYGRKLAWIRVCKDFAEQHPQSQRQYLTHELVHCHIDRTDSVMRSLESVLGLAAFKVLESNHHLAVEDATDALAEVIAPHMPPFELPAAS